ncbi:adenylosuccinate lyase, partial [candidate division WOR-3 bacterium]|nr:adenylosuccinate lyase [candidate division WOR-3 bacterium]
CERVIFPDATTLIDYSLEKLLFILKNLTVDEERMGKNLDLTKGLIFSQRVLLKLIEKGMTREDAYKVVQSNAMKVWKGKEEFLTVLLGDKRIKKLLKRKELESCFDVNYYLKNIDYIYKKVLG